MLIDRRLEVGAEAVARGLLLRARAEGKRSCAFDGVTQYVPPSELACPKIRFSFLLYAHVGLCVDHVHLHVQVSVREGIKWHNTPICFSPGTR